MPLLLPQQWLVAVSLASLTIQTLAFVFVPPKAVWTAQRRWNWRTSTTMIRHLGSDGNINIMDDDEYLRQSLKRAANEKLGAPIPIEVN